MKINRLVKELSFCLLAPIFVLGACILLPGEYLRECLNVIFWPIESLIADRETQHELALLIFGKVSPNYAPIQLLLYMTFWSVVLFVLIRIGGALWLNLTNR